MIEFRFLLDFHKPSNDSFYRWIYILVYHLERASDSPTDFSWQGVDVLWGLKGWYTKCETTTYKDWDGDTFTYTKTWGLFCMDNIGNFFS